MKLAPPRGPELAATPSESLAVASALEQIRDVVLCANYPCLGAKAALNADSQSLHVYDELGSSASISSLADHLHQFIESAIPRAGDYATFIAVFRAPVALDEIEFEERLWRELSLLHEIDNADWDRSVSPDPADPQFSFSFAGQAFYVIGLHPNSSRIARRFPWPTLVFNPHEQFERLRADGKWRKMQQSIRSRDAQLQGSINPMMSDFGESSEARQYSGRAVPEGWEPPIGKCPFQH